MEDVNVSSSDGKIHEAVDAMERKLAPPQHQQQEKFGDGRPQLSFDSESDQRSSVFLGLSVDSRREDERPDEQIEKLKEFLSEASCHGDDVVTQHDADTVKALENVQNFQHLQLGTELNTGLGARLESPARAKLEIENQAASGFYPSETVYLEEHRLKEVLEGSSAALSVQSPSTVAHTYPPKLGLFSPDVPPSPTRNIDAAPDLKNELDCLFQERASRFRDSH